MSDPVIKFPDFKCSNCGRPLKEPGALLFSVPLKVPDVLLGTRPRQTSMLVWKDHLCVECMTVPLGSVP